jgi:hypothetical protein
VVPSLHVGGASYPPRWQATPFELTPSQLFKRV